MDWQLIQPIFHWLSDHPAWSGLFVFLIALTESLVIVGLIVPGTILMFGVGTLVGTGVLDVKLVLFLAFLGAVIGDGVSFWFGATYREQISDFWPFKNNPKILEKGKSFFSRHGGKSVFFGRFVGPIRPVIPAVAGMMHMPPKTFFAINIISAAGWAPFYLVPGILFGSSIGLASAIGSRLVIILLSVVVGAALVLFIVKKSMRFAMPKLEGWFDALIQWSSRHKLFGKFVLVLIDPHKSTKIGFLYSVSILAFSVLFLTTFVLSLWSPWLLHIDAVVKNIFVLLRSDPGDWLMWVIQNSLSWLILLLALVNVLVGLYYSGLKKLFNYFSSLLLTTFFLSLLTLFVFSLFDVEIADSFSYVHLSLLASSLLFYAVISSENSAVKYHWLYYAFSIVVLFGLAFSEVYFSMLMLSQVIIAFSLSATWVLIFSLAYRRHTHHVKSLAFISSTTAVICLLVASLTISSHSHREILWLNKTEVEVMLSKDWVDGGWKNLSKNRADVFGKQKNNLNLQWQGGLAEIKKTLLNSGWQVSPPVSLRSLLYWLVPEPELSQVVRLPQTNDGETESLLYTKIINDRQVVLQLWPSLLKNENGISIWLGAISTQQLISGEKWLSFFQIENADVTILSTDKKITSHWTMISKKRKALSSNNKQAEVLLLYPKRDKNEK